MSKGKVICSPWYLLVVYVWDIVGHILFSGVYIQLYIEDCLLFFSYNRTECRRLGTYTVCTFIIVI